MNLSALKTLALQKGSRSLFTIQKHSPALLTAGGIVGFTTAGVLAVRATFKAQPVLDRIREDARAVRGSITSTKEEQGKDLTKIYLLGGVDLLKHYWPAITTAAVSVVALVAAHKILDRRSVAALAAYKLIEQSYQEYRQRVIEEFGEDKDKDFRRGVYEEKVTDPETGKTKKVVRIDKAQAASMYARFFEKGVTEMWDPEPGYNLMHVKNVQQWANDRLQIKGYLFLNEVYKQLGFPDTRAGQLVGWVFDKEKGADNYVDFGIYDIENEAKRAFVNWDEKSILLDFNVDGPIIDKF